MKHFLNEPTPILLSKNNPKIQTGPGYLPLGTDSFLGGLSSKNIIFHET
jgi:hypothetical protein